MAVKGIPCGGVNTVLAVTDPGAHDFPSQGFACYFQGGAERGGGRSFIWRCGGWRRGASKRNFLLNGKKLLKGGKKNDVAAGGCEKLKELG